MIKRQGYCNSNNRMTLLCFVIVIITTIIAVMDLNNGNGSSLTFVSSWSSPLLLSSSHKYKKSTSTMMFTSLQQQQQLKQKLKYDHNCLYGTIDSNSNSCIGEHTNKNINKNIFDSSKNNKNVQTNIRSVNTKDANQSIFPPKTTSFIKQITLSTMLCLLSFFIPIINTNMIPISMISYANDDTSKIVGQLKGSGLFFKDTLQIESFDDPKVKGVKLYISTFQIPLTEKLNGKNLFQDPSYASLTCTRINNIPISIASNINKDISGEEVFEEKKSLLFKDLRVYRVYDTKTNTIVYVSYNTRFDKSDDTNKSRFKSSLCAINLNDPIVTSTTNTLTELSSSATTSPAAAEVAGTK